MTAPTSETPLGDDQGRDGSTNLPQCNTPPAPVQEPACMIAALELLALGLRPIPVNPATKEALVKWKPLQRRQPTEAEVRAWWRGFPNAALAILTGTPGGVDVVDVDPGAPDDWPGPDRELPTGYVVQTPRGGRHYYMAAAGLPTTAGVLALHVDTRGQGGYVLCPPSIRNGEPYRALLGSLEEALETPAPAWLVAAFNGQKQGKPALLAGAPEGARNDSAASVIGVFLAKGIPPDLAWDAAQAWNARNMPPLPEPELHKVFDSIVAREAVKSGSSEGATTADLLAVFNERLDTHVAAAFIVQGDSPTLHLRHENGQSQVATVRQWPSPNYACGVLTALELVVVIPPKAPEWRKLANLVLRAAEHREVGSEGTEAGDLLRAVSQYVNDTGGAVEKKKGGTIYMGERGRASCMKDGFFDLGVAYDENGEVWVIPGIVIERMRERKSIRLTASGVDLTRALAAVGAVRETVKCVECDEDTGRARRASRTTRSVWRLP